MIASKLETVDRNVQETAAYLTKKDIGEKKEKDTAKKEVQDAATAEREIEGGKETLKCKLPLIIGGQKGLVEESDLKIPNMRGIMQARQKPLLLIEPSEIKVKTP